MDKLAEEILKPFIIGAIGVPVVNKEDAIKAMQSYHEAKLKEITLADIEAWARKGNDKIPAMINRLLVWICHHYITGLMDGAKAALNGEIKHIK